MRRAMRAIDANDVLTVVGLVASLLVAWWADPRLTLVVVGLFLAMVGLVRSR